MVAPWSAYRVSLVSTALPLGKWLMSWGTGAWEPLSLCKGWTLCPTFPMSPLSWYCSPDWWLCPYCLECCLVAHNGSAEAIWRHCLLTDIHYEDRRFLVQLSCVPRTQRDRRTQHSTSCRCETSAGCLHCSCALCHSVIIPWGFHWSTQFPRVACPAPPLSWCAANLPASSWTWCMYSDTGKSPGDLPPLHHQFLECLSQEYPVFCYLMGHS